jgi:hypothetical protein
VDVQIHIFLTSALAGGEWSASRPGRSTSGEKAPGTHWIGGWVGPRAGLDANGPGHNLNFQGMLSTKNFVQTVQVTMGKGDISLTEFWKNFNIRQAIENIYESW